jgi:hypothetical protein
MLVVGPIGSPYSQADEDHDDGYYSRSAEVFMTGCWSPYSYTDGQHASINGLCLAGDRSGAVNSVRGMRD